jgi:WD40 repeat protein
MTITQRGIANPYVGPRPFEIGERLYGRDRDAKRLLDLLIAERIVLVYSPSGAGKTSLIRAALIPALWRAGFRVLPIAPDSPGNSAAQTSLIRLNRTPLADLAELADFSSRNRYIVSTLLSLEEGLPPARQLPPAKLAEQAGEAFEAYLEQRPGADESGQEVLIFDQFEEILTLDPTDVEAKDAFFDWLGDALADRRRWALFAIREDLVAGLDPYRPALPTELNATFRLDLLSIGQARESIQRPAEDAGGSFDDPAATELIEALRRVLIQHSDSTIDWRPGPYVEPVEIQVVCRWLWENFGPRILKEHVATIENVRDSLARYFAEQVSEISNQCHVNERLIRDWFDGRLITPQHIRGADRGEGVDHAVIQRLVDVHLVRAEPRRNVTWYELAHDSLIPPILEDNQRWRDAHLHLLQRQAALWEVESRSSGLLLGDAALAEAERWANDHQEDLTGVDRDFLSECLKARDRSEHEQRTNRLIRRLAILALFIACVAILGFAVAAVLYATQARQQSEIEAGELAASALATLSSDPEESVRLAMLAEQKYPSLRSESALRRSLYESHERVTMRGHGGAVNRVAYSPDGRLLATAGADGTARVWEASTGTALAVLHGHTGTVWIAAFSPDGRLLVTAGADGIARVWEASTGTALAELRGHTHAVWIAAFSPDGRLLATAGADGTARVWEASTGTALAVLHGHTGVVNSVAFSPGGERLVTAADDRTARVWDSLTGSSMTDLRGHSAWVRSAAFSRDGRWVVTASWDGTARVWEAATGVPVTILRGHVGPARSPIFSPDGQRVATAGEDGTARIWEAGIGAPTIILRGHTAAVNGAAFSSPDGRRVVTASSDGTARVWETATGEPVAVLTGHAGRVWAAAFSPDGRLVVTAGGDQTARVWEADTGRVLAILDGHTGAVNDVTFSPDGRRVVTASWDKTARVWEAATGDPVAVLLGHEDRISDAAFSPDGRLVVTASWDRTARVWDAGTGGLIATVEHDDAVTSAAFSPDGQLVATASTDRLVRLANISMGTRDTLRGHIGPVNSVAFSPDGRWVATGSADQTARLWDVTTKKDMVLRGHTDSVVRAAFSQDSNWVATASEDGTMRIWQASTGTIVATLRGHTGPVWSAAFHPDGRSVVTASTDGTAQISACEWCIASVDELLGIARRALMRELNPDVPVAYSAVSPDRSSLLHVPDRLRVILVVAAIGVVASAATLLIRRRLARHQPQPRT